jgi:GTP:adenosylcobinamide-phosphate guanylyltransferase
MPGATPQRYAVLVLAGRRGADDPLADAAGAPHRALLDLFGTPMLAMVLETLRTHPRLAQIHLSMDALHLLKEVAPIQALIDSGEVICVPVAPTPSRSVLAGLDAIGDDFPMLVTTADHALLDHAMIDFFLDAAERTDGDLVVGLVPSRVIRARFPEAKRTYLPFRGERYSGANLFAFRSAKAREVVSFWRRAEAFRKTPWRMVSAFGLLNLLLFSIRVLDLNAAFRRVSKVVGAQARAVEMPIAEAAVDVDKIEDLELVRKILAERR